jgi:hypothetical protein
MFILNNKKPGSLFSAPGFSISAPVARRRRPTSWEGGRVYSTKRIFRGREERRFV